MYLSRTSFKFFWMGFNAKLDKWVFSIQAMLSALKGLDQPGALKRDSTLINYSENKEKGIKIQSS